jgi:CHAD domain-containing protein
MLNRKTQQRHFRENVETVDKSLKVFRKKQDKEALHKLRVEVKKMKAALLLQSGSFSDEKLPPEFEETRKVFKAAGKIREADINVKLLEEHHITDKKIKKKLQEIVKKKGKEFHEKVDAHLEKVHKHISFFLRRFYDLPDRKIERLFSKELHGLAEASQVRLGPVQLHDCRKKLKNLLYVHASLLPSTVKKMKINTFYLKKLEETIGEWHDVIIIVDLLKEEGYSAKEIPGKLLAEKVRARKKVNELFIDFRRNSFLS